MFMSMLDKFKKITALPTVLILLFTALSFLAILTLLETILLLPFNNKLNIKITNLVEKIYNAAIKTYTRHS